MNTGTKTLINTIIESIQDVKGKHIVIANLEKIDDTEYNYLIICDGSSNSQISSIVERVKDEVNRMRSGLQWITEILLYTLSFLTKENTIA